MSDHMLPNLEMQGYNTQQEVHDEEYNERKSPFHLFTENSIPYLFVESEPFKPSVIEKQRKTMDWFEAALEDEGGNGQKVEDGNVDKEKEVNMEKGNRTEMKIEKPPQVDDEDLDDDDEVNESPLEPQPQPEKPVYHMQQEQFLGKPTNIDTTMEYFVEKHLAMDEEPEEEQNDEEDGEDQSKISISIKDLNELIDERVKERLNNAKQEDTTNHNEKREKREKEPEAQQKTVSPQFIEEEQLRANLASTFELITGDKSGEEKSKFENIFESALQKAYEYMLETARIDVNGIEKMQSRTWKNSNEFKWVRELFIYLKEENIELRDSLTIREGQLKLLRHTNAKLSDENKISMETLRALKKKLAHYQRVIKKNMLQPKEESYIPQIAAKMNTLAASSPNRSFASPNSPSFKKSLKEAVEEQKAATAKTSPVKSMELGSEHNEDTMENEEITSTTSDRSPRPSHDQPKRKRKLSKKKRKTKKKQEEEAEMSDKQQALIDARAKRMLRALRGAPSAKEQAKEVDKRVRELKRTFQKDYDINLPLTKSGPCTYLLGRKKFNLAIAGDKLTVLLGGGKQDFLNYVRRFLISTSVNTAPPPFVKSDVV